MDSDSIVVGRVVAPWGVKGELKVEVITDFPDRFSPEEQVYIDGSPVTIEMSRWHKGMVILKLANIDSVEAVEKIRGQFIEVPQGQVRSLSENEYYQFQVVGLEVWTTNGEFLGRITQILPTGNNDVYVVRSEDREVLIPAIDDVVKSVELEQGRIVIEVIEGLLQEQP
ncbi:MAG: ribosome maturation factor RimM [Dehalococcoidia bacterium]